MKDTIIKLFNLEPSELKDVEIISTDFSVVALVTLNVRHQRCPACGCSTKHIHDYQKRTLNHAVINDVYTTIVFNQRRYRCTRCNKTFPEANPFAFPNRRISKYVVLRVMKMLKNPRITFSYVADEIGMSTSSVIRIFDKFAGITPISLPTCLCIDEVYAVKHTQKVYACIIADMQKSQIYDLLPSRKKADLTAYLSRISLEERSKVKYVSMDMFPLYKDVVSLFFPNAKICIDSFHVIQLVNNAFNKIRIRVMKNFDTTSEEYYLLKHYSWILLKNSSHLPLDESLDLRHYYYVIGGQYITYRALIDKMVSWSYELTAAYSMKETYSYINKHSTPENAERRIENLIGELLLYDIRDLNAVARTLRRWKPEIVNSFDRVDGQRISNGPIESINARIKLIKKNGNGYRNFDRFRKRVLYSLNDNSSIKI